MNAYRACGLCEGFEEPRDDDEVIEAWQFMIDTGLAWKLQGRFGRTANDLIEGGICSPPQPTHDPIPGGPQ